MARKSYSGGERLTVDGVTFFLSNFLFKNQIFCTGMSSHEKKVGSLIVCGCGISVLKQRLPLSPLFVKRAFIVKKTVNIRVFWDIAIC